MAALALPPAAYGDVLGAAQRAEYERRYWSLVEGVENYGVATTWVGQGALPKSDWKYDYTERERHIQALGEAAEVLTPAPVLDARAASRNEWRGLMQQRRRMQA